jgi:HTH-type transcriptional regulator / antitoxin HigA
MKRLRKAPKPIEIRIIDSEEHYAAALARAKYLLDFVKNDGSDLASELEMLLLLIEEYEEREYPFPDVITPQQAMQLEMQERNLKQADLVPYFGSKSRVSEFLAGKRELTLPTIRKLHKELGIPLHILVGV